MRIALLLASVALVALTARPVPAATATFAPAGSRITMNVRSLQELRFARLVQQSWDVSCGAAALSTLLTYHHGKAISEYTVATWILRGVDPALVRSRGGFSLLDLKRFATAAGFQAEGYGNMTMDELVGLGVPAIVPVSMHGLDHFVVMRGVLGGRVVLGDPAFGNLTVSVGQFQQLWKGGIAFVVSGTDEHVNNPTDLAPTSVDLRVPDLPQVARLLRGGGPSPLTRRQASVP